jgi:antitoxin VapB
METDTLFSPLYFARPPKNAKNQDLTPDFCPIFQLTPEVALYILHVNTIGGARIMRAAKVFKSGNSQAVRLPKEFQLDVKEVGIFRQGSDLILRPMKKTWQGYFSKSTKFTADYPDQIEDMPAEERGGL